MRKLNSGKVHHPDKSVLCDAEESNGRAETAPPFGRQSATQSHSQAEPQFPPRPLEPGIDIILSGFIIFNHLRLFVLNYLFYYLQSRFEVVK